MAHTLQPRHSGHQHTLTPTFMSPASPRQTLIIVDCQNDFSRPDAPLFVAGSDDAITAIVDLIDSHTIGHVIFTVDWHPYNHCSFQAQGGLWPTHCVQHTEGAAIRPELLEACTRHNLPYTIFTKGSDPNTEEYGAFSGTWSETPEAFIIQHDTTSFSIAKANDYILCGIAGDYCVKETLLNIAHRLHPKVFMPGVAHIGGEHILLKEMQALGVTLYTNQ